MTTQSTITAEEKNATLRTIKYRGVFGRIQRIFQEMCSDKRYSLKIKFKYPYIGDDESDVMISIWFDDDYNHRPLYEQTVLAGVIKENAHDSYITESLEAIFKMIKEKHDFDLTGQSKKQLPNWLKVEPVTSIWNEPFICNDNDRKIAVLATADHKAALIIPEDHVVVLIPKWHARDIRNYFSHDEQLVNDATYDETFPPAVFYRLLDKVIDHVISTEQQKKTKS